MPKISVPIDGHCDSAFEGIEKVFAACLADESEYGVAVSLVVKGEVAVDLWGGYQDAERTKPWEKDTIVCMFSTGKSIGAFCVLMLVDRGQIELDLPVATYWPEFAQAGKEAVTVRQVLSHNSGVVFLDHAPEASIFDYDTIIEAIEKQVPNWEPGKQHAYHTFTTGFLVRELVTRVTGKNIADFWRDEVAEPFGIDFALALSKEQEGRCATVYADDDDAFVTAMRDPSTGIGRAWSRFPSKGNATVLFNSAEWNSWGVPNIGFGNPRALARVYGALANGCQFDGRELISPNLFEEAIRSHWDGLDAVLELPIRDGLGFLLTSETFPFNENPHAFFGLGAGGACVFGDPDSNLAFSYCSNHMGPYIGDGVPLVKQIVSEIKNRDF